jgi:hypothetical protein
MTAFNSGSGGTFSGIANLEDWTAAHLQFLRIQQGNSAKNPKSLKYLTLTTNTEGAISGSFNCPVLVSTTANGAAVITATSYLTGVSYTAPTGGDALATNEVQALIDAVIRQRTLELAGTTINPKNANYLNFSLTMGSTGGVPGTNANVSITFSGLPVDMVQGSNGSVTFEGQTYLT